MIPVTTYKKTDNYFFQCDGVNHYCVDRDSGLNLMPKGAKCDLSCKAVKE